MASNSNNASVSRVLLRAIVVRGVADWLLELLVATAVLSGSGITVAGLIGLAPLDHGRAVLLSIQISICTCSVMPGITDGFQNKMEKSVEVAYGVRNVEYDRLRVLAHCGRDDMINRVR